MARRATDKLESVCDLVWKKSELSVSFQSMQNDVHQWRVGSRILTSNQLAILDRMRMPCLDIGNLSASNLQGILGKEKRIALEDILGRNLLFRIAEDGHVVASIRPAGGN